MVQYVRSVDFCGTFYLRLAGALCAGLRAAARSGPALGVE